MTKLNLERELEGINYVTEMKVENPELCTVTSYAELGEITGVGRFDFLKHFKDSPDMANIRTSEAFGRLYALKDLLVKLGEKEDDKARKQMFVTGSKSVEEEINFLTQEKEKFYRKVKENRAGDTSNKIKTLHINEDGTVVEVDK